MENGHTNEWRKIDEKRKREKETKGNFVTLADDDINKRAKFLNFKSGTKIILGFGIGSIIQLFRKFVDQITFLTF